MKKILVPTDFSTNSKHALRYAAELAIAMGAKLEILHANTVVAYATPVPEYFPLEGYAAQDYDDSAADELHSLKRDLTDLLKFEKLEIETRVEEGFLHSTMRRTAEEDGCDLIVMGTKGASGATEFFVGSNTEKVIRTAPCPVLAVPEDSGDFTLKSVVLATTLKPDQAVAFNLLGEWQKSFPFDLKVLYLNNPAGLDSMDEIEAANQKFCAEVGLKNADVFASSNTFNEELAILRFAEECDANLIVMATHQRRGLSHLLFGSLAEDTTNHSEIPVLSVPI